MFAIERYLQNNGVKTNYPKPDKIGFTGYALKTNANSWDYNFLFYIWENTKAHPSYYSMKFYQVLKINSSKYFLDSKIRYINWDSFFEEIEIIKNKILNNKFYKIPKNKHEMEDLLWESYLKTQDFNLAPMIKNLPDVFYDTIDETKTCYQRYDARQKFMEFLKNHMYNSFFAWIHFVPEDFRSNFCDWFHNYMLDVQ